MVIFSQCKHGSFERQKVFTSVNLKAACLLILQTKQKAGRRTKQRKRFEPSSLARVESLVWSVPTPSLSSSSFATSSSSLLPYPAKYGLNSDISFADINTPNGVAFSPDVVELFPGGAEATTGDELLWAVLSAIFTCLPYLKQESVHYIYQKSEVIKL